MNQTDFAINNYNFNTLINFNVLNKSFIKYTSLFKDIYLIKLLEV
jgi:hypothetical protein